MTKAERLIRILNFLRTNAVASVTELSRVFKVSERTVYRDIDLLARIGVPLYYDGGYRLREEADRIVSSLNAEDRALLAMCLMHSRLSDYPGFERRLVKLREKLFGGTAAGVEDLADRVLLSDRYTEKYSGVTEREQTVIDTFLHAVVHQRAIAVVTKSSVPRLIRCMPIALRLGRRRRSLVVEPLGGGAPIEIAVDDIAALRAADRSGK